MAKDDQKVLKVNEAFYSALINGDYQAMESLWSHASEVAVIHPGWPPLHGREAVMDSWQRILDGGSTRGMYCANAVCYQMSDAAFVICTESFPEGELVATNIYVREDGDWKIVHHQGGPIQSMNDDEAPERVH